MKSLLAIVVVLVGAAVSQACPVAVQAFGVQAQCVAPQAIVQSYAPVQVQAFAVPFAVVPQAVVVQNVHVRQQNVRQRSFSRTVVRQRSR